MRPLVVLCILSMLGCSSRDVVEQRFENMNEASRAGAIERGWLPRFTPQSSFDIQLRYDLDTNEVWISFGWDGTDGELDKQCKPFSLTLEDLPKRSPTWWPHELSPSTSTESLAALKNLLRCSDGGVMVLQPEHKRGYYWHRGSQPGDIGS